MNVLICSAGRRVKLIQYFKKTLSNNRGKVIAADCDLNAPALYFADGYDLIPPIDDNEYVSSVVALCEKHNINGVVSLIDPELEVLANDKEKFNEIGVTLVLSPLDMIQYCFDKQETYYYLSEIGISAVPTYSELEQVKVLQNKQELTFPLVVKPGKGSASIGIEITNNSTELESIFTKSDNLIIQPYYKEREYGIDAYIDMISGELIELFIKEKIKMRSGETDKSISVHNDKIERLIKDFITKTKFIGPIDIDCFEYNGNYFISEINPRFGGGYPHAYEMGCDFMEYIVNNLEGNANNRYGGYSYEKGYVMMKYDDVILREQN